jgi:GNAT superfamily N-acetyltransferase
MPMHIDEAALGWMQEKFDFDLEASRIAFRDGEPVGLVNLGVREANAWIGGVGVVASARRGGVGEALMHAAHDEARSRGVQRVWCSSTQASPSP